MAAANTFTLFSLLPGELRNQIWHMVIQSTTKTQHIHRYRSGGWQPRHLVLGKDAHYHPGGEHDNIDLEWQHAIFNDIRIDMPLAWVNREARSIALAWMEENGVKLASPSPQQIRNARYARPFNPSFDAVYIPDHDSLVEFFEEYYKRFFEPDLLRKTVGTWSWIRYVAMPEVLFWKEMDVGGFEALAENHMFLRAVLVVVADGPQLEGNDWSCEYESADLGLIRWRQSQSKFEYEGSEDSPGSGQLCALAKDLADAAAQDDVHGVNFLPDGFEVRFIRLRHKQ
ncbi:hypothetical protein OQA88_11238 [Cercophora sp. LCS_1]